MSSTFAIHDLPIVDAPPAPGPPPGADRPLTVMLVGNPNAGKTSLFNDLTGLRAKTSNFPGTTFEHRRATVELHGLRATLIDLPGLYSLDAGTPDERVTRDALLGRLDGVAPPDAVVFVADSTNLERNLFLAGEVVELGRPVVVALNFYDLAEKRGLRFDVDELEAQLGCPVVPISARTGFGLPTLLEELAHTARQNEPPPPPPALAACRSCAGCQFAARYDWAERVGAAAVRTRAGEPGRFTEAVDRVLTHRVGGLAAFAAVMTALFLAVFWAAQYPMAIIETLFGLASATLGRWLPAGDFSSFVTDGVVGGVGGVLVFLPQIAALFFVLALLDDSGYMARAALVMDRLMRRVGLPGKAFVPMLSAHACAIPAIMSTRVIDDRRDRLAAIMVIPLMTCSARVPVYAMVTSLLFPHRAWAAALVFVGAYALGIVAALGMGWVFKRTLLRGAVRPLLIELPDYRRPSIRNALLLTWDRSLAFVKTAGTTILVLSIALWAAATYPKTPVERMPEEAQARLAALAEAGDEAGRAQLTAQLQLEHSLAGRAGRLVEPVFAPLGFDWRTSIGVLTSFAAREVVVSTMAVLYGLGAEGDQASLGETLRTAERADGTLLFTPAACLSLLVFYVLAMQCLPTQAVTRRETGSWRWPLVQLGYMTALAYTAALVTYQVARWAGL